MLSMAKQTRRPRDAQNSHNPWHYLWRSVEIRSYFNFMQCFDMIMESTAIVAMISGRFLDASKFAVMGAIYATNKENKENMESTTKIQINHERRTTLTSFFRFALSTSRIFGPKFFGCSSRCFFRVTWKNMETNISRCGEQENERRTAARYYSQISNYNAFPPAA